MAKGRRVSKTFGEQVRATRDRKGWSQDRLAAELEKLGEPMDRATIARIEAGRRGVSVDDLVIFALALGVAPVYLLLPRAKDPVTLASDVTVDGWEALAWMRGILPAVDAAGDDSTPARSEDEVHWVRPTASADRRFFYEACPDYEAETMRRFPVVHDLWVTAALSMFWASDDSNRPALRRTLVYAAASADLALARLDAEDKEN